MRPKTAFFICVKPSFSELFLLGSLCRLLKCFGCWCAWLSRLPHFLSAPGSNPCFFSGDVGIKSCWLFHFFFMGLAIGADFIAGLDFPALDKAIATACFWGIFSSRIVLMFALITLELFPDFRGICLGGFMVAVPV